ncbi:MAG: hypothetical protein H6668_19090 [Ardenticatenaceae bacterium]|nr:hypothetical protein [Ardenticatenaceae bacterium]
MAADEDVDGLDEVAQGEGRWYLNGPFVTPAKTNCARPTSYANQVMAAPHSSQPMTTLNSLLTETAGHGEEG